MTASLRARLRPPTAATPARGSGRVIRGPVRERHEPDYPIVVAAIGLVAMGILMIYSSSAVRIALDPEGDLFRALLTELFWAGLGIALMVLLMRLDYRHLRAVSVPIFAVALILLVLVILPPIGPIQPIESGGAARWLKIGPLPQLHPAELAKIALVIYLAHWLARRGARLRSVTEGLLPFLFVAGSVIGLIMLEPDLGTTGVVTISSFLLFLLAGGRFLHVAALVPPGFAVIVLYVNSNPYQLQRWTTFLDPWSVALKEGFHTVQGLYALALGGILGGGLGQSRAPGGLYLPNADNDYIFAMVGQEFGLVGGLLVIGLFLLLGYRGLRVATQAPDLFGMLLAAGVTVVLCVQAFLNIAVVVNLIPVTGITLPFISSGGTSLVVSLAAVGILLSVSRETTTRRSVQDDEDHDRGGGDGWTHLSRPRRPALPRRAAR